MELGLEVAVLLARRSPCGLDQHGLEPWSTGPKSGTHSSAGALVVARTESGPRDQVPSGREAAHVIADLSQDDVRGDVADAGDGRQEFDGSAKRLQVLADALVDPCHLPSNRVDQAQMRADHEAVVISQPALQRLREDFLGGPYARRGASSESIRLRFASDDRIQERTQGQVSPESWTHGSSEQRKSWFVRGLEGSGPASCDTFRGEV